MGKMENINVTVFLMSDPQIQEPNPRIKLIRNVAFLQGHTRVRSPSFPVSYTCYAMFMTTFIYNDKVQDLI